MATNVATNITKALTGYNIRTETGWTDDTVVSHWLKDKKVTNSL